jgi:hypothetical protein
MALLPLLSAAAGDMMGEREDAEEDSSLVRDALSLFGK